MRIRDGQSHGRKTVARKIAKVCFQRNRLTWDNGTDKGADLG